MPRINKELGIGFIEKGVSEWCLTTAFMCVVAVVSCVCRLPIDEKSFDDTTMHAGPAHML